MRSPAKILAYGGAMGGGKSRCMMEAVFDYALDYPGLLAVVARDKHTTIINSTRKTMLEQVLPLQGLPLVEHKKQSGGEDYIRLFNGSEIHFVGMDDPYRWYSAEISIFALDEAQEISNFDHEKVVRLITRLRQRCHDCIRAGERDCPHLPHKAMLSFNPSNPGHWLKEWFIDGAQRTPHGFRKEKLVLPGAKRPLGDAEFVFALPKDNPYLAADYLDTLEGLPEHLRRRYLDGEWDFLNQLGFFDSEALSYYADVARQTLPVFQGETVGDVDEDLRWRRDGRTWERKEPIALRKGDGQLEVWKLPDPKHRYVMAIDVSSGGSYDYSAVQVVDVDAFEQVAEWQGKADPDLVAREAFRIGRLYNDALAVPEITGGWGFTVDQELKRLRYPKPYTRTIYDRIAKKFTDRTGWDTTIKTRAHMLDTLERVVREREFGLYSYKAVGEMATFVYREKETGFAKPEAQPGCNDDLVMSLAIAVTVALSLPKELRTASPTRLYQPLGRKKTSRTRFGSVDDIPRPEHKRLRRR